jgi:hypothetical protein
MPGGSEPLTWGSNARQAIGSALVEAGPEGMTAAELAAATGKDQSNLKKVADELVQEGVLRITRPAPSSRRGRRASTAFAFSEGERERFETFVSEPRQRGVLEPGVHLVIVDAPAKDESLSEVLSEAEAVREVAWSVYIDGERPELAFAFRGSDAVDDSLDLMAIFAAAELEARRASVGKVETPEELVESERRRKQGVDRSRARRRSVKPGSRVGR